MWGLAPTERMTRFGGGGMEGGGKNIREAGLEMVKGGGTYNIKTGLQMGKAFSGSLRKVIIKKIKMKRSH